MKTKRKLVLKPFVLPTLCSLLALTAVTGMFFSIEEEKVHDSFTYVSGIILNDNVPVLKEEETIIQP